jgi:3-dehydroquinate dehydratase / shikimate dehydrogenase
MMMPEPKPRICAVVAEESVAAATRALERAASEADLIELRLDYLLDFDFCRVDQLRQILGAKPLPVILTCRDINEGGAQKIDDEVRYRLLVEGARQFADYCDIEAAHFEKLATFSPDLSKLIVSYHDYKETPDSVDALYERLTRLPAAIHKIATRANTASDSLFAFQLLERAKKDQKCLIAIAMGEAGLLTRLLGPSRGSWLTYGALEETRQSAPGQVSCADLKTLYRIGNLTGETQITGIIGEPVSHSASPAIHNSAFSALKLDFVYLPIEVDHLGDFFARFVTPSSREMDWNLRGLSVTIPHKVAVMPLLDEVDEVAAAIGAVNTVVVDGGRLLGYNTDASGAMKPLLRALSLKGARCSVIGAGGAARAVLYGLVNQGAEVTVFARDRQKARALADTFQCGLAPLESLERIEADVLINATPIGMQGHSRGHSPVRLAALPPPRVVYDLVYNPLETRLLREARMAGCQTIGGLDMLIDQAALQFELWTGQAPNHDVMREAALKTLATRTASPTDSPE